jgi:hypothetical protein
MAWTSSGGRVTVISVECPLHTTRKLIGTATAHETLERWRGSYPRHVWGKKTKKKTRRRWCATLALENERPGGVTRGIRTERKYRKQGSCTYPRTMYLEGVEIENEWMRVE